MGDFILREEKKMELKDFITFLERNITEEAFEAMALIFAERHGYKITGCNFNLRDNVKIYKLHRWLTSDECYMVVNYYNNFLAASDYPRDDFMIVDDNVDTLMCLCDSLYSTERIDSRVPKCLKDICNCIFEFTKYPLKYFNFECQNKFYEHIYSRHKKAEDNYLENLMRMFQKCKKETLTELTNTGLLKSKNDWKEKTNTATLTYDDGSSRQFCFVFQYDGMVEVSEKNTMRLFCMYIAEDNDIQKFKERVLRFVI